MQNHTISYLIAFTISFGNSMSSKKRCLILSNDATESFVAESVSLLTNYNWMNVNGSLRILCFYSITMFSWHIMVYINLQSFVSFFLNFEVCKSCHLKRILLQSKISRKLFIPVKCKHRFAGK